jgi:hypothetical protein
MDHSWKLLTSSSPYIAGDFILTLKGILYSLDSVLLNILQ